ncbi:MAG: TonB-dependent receptor plug domain-containing protein [Cyclobacteriaceae bacterium]|nr:TonB-dependent receptor plug domain-containing protein [Cyclobacteriaceae bacterium]
MRKILLLVGLFMSLNLTLSAQERTVSGKVTSAEDGTALPGVNVVIKGTTVGTVTDLAGNYKLSVPAGGSPSLVFSFIGLNTTEIAIGERSIVDVSLGLDVTQLNEVVVVGYGTQLKQDLTGNIAKVNGDAIQNLSVTTFEQAMQGRAAGVLVTQQNGKLGQGLNIRIRGSSSISAGNEPLYVVDGMIINNDNLSGTDAATNALADLNSNDIASLEILKDAAASAIYGARAANGVVLITTKRGKAGKTNFTANYQFGSSQPTRHREFLNSAQYVELMRESAYNNDLRSGYDPINNPYILPRTLTRNLDSQLDC